MRLAMKLWGAVVGVAMSGCAIDASMDEVIEEKEAALTTQCGAIQCASGFVCAADDLCVRPSSCFSGATGPGVLSGSYVIDATDTAADLQALAGAWCVTGNVTVKQTQLGNLAGLSGLVTVAGTLSVEDNAQLTTLTGLEKLSRATKVALFRNAQLASLGALSQLSSLSSVQVYVNPKLSNLDGLQSVTTLSNAEIVNNAGLTSLSGLHALTRLHSYIDVRQNPQLSNLVGLDALTYVGSYVQIMDNPQLVDLTGLGQLGTVNSTLRVMRNARLGSFAALTALTRAPVFQVSDNPLLDSCTVTDVATRVAANTSACVRNGPCVPIDHCPLDPDKLDPGVCGCGVADVDTDGDETFDCFDACASDPEKISVGLCGCGVPDVADDGDGDGVADCVDICPLDNPDDADGDGVCASDDRCPGFDDRVDVDANGIPDGCQECVSDADCDDGDACTEDACSATACVQTFQFGLCPSDWVTQTGSSLADTYLGGARAQDGSLYVAGRTSGVLPGQASAGGFDASLSKFDEAGALLWVRQFGSSASDVANGVAVDSDGEVFVVGSTGGALPGEAHAGANDGFVRKYSAEGDLLWTRLIATGVIDNAHAVAVDHDDDVIVVGYTTSALPGQTSAGSLDVFARKFSNDGDVVWTRQFGSSLGESPSSIVVDVNGNWAITGHTNGALPGQVKGGTMYNYDGFVARFDSAGSMLWLHQFGDVDQEYGEDVGFGADGSLFVSGRTRVQSLAQSDLFLRKYDAAGAFAWALEFGTPQDEDCESALVVDSNGDVVVAGGTRGTFPGQQRTSPSLADLFYRKYSSSGALVTTRQFGPSGHEILNDLLLTEGGHLVFVGSTTSALPGQTSAGGWDAFVWHLVQ